MKTLQSAHLAATTIDNLLSAYGDIGVSYVSAGSSKEDIERYPHLAKRARLRRAVYDASTKCTEAAQALDDANEELIAALREVRRLP